jgi:tetratricopeptide (TPR) repeat protein
MDNAFDIADEAKRLARRKRFSEALALCDKIIANWPHAYVGHYWKGVILEDMGELDHALKCMTRVAELHPTDAPPFFARAHVFMKLGRYAEALDDLDKVEKYDKDRFFGSHTPLLRADCHCQLDNLDEAENWCRAVRDDHVNYTLKGHLRSTKQEVLEEIKKKRGCGCS